MKSQVVYIGVDARPVNTKLVEDIAKIGGAFELVVPPSGTYGQELMDWLKLNTDNLTEFVLSTDAIGYGDLRESKTYYPLEYIDATLYSTFEALRATFPGVPVTVFNSILGLLPNTYDYDGKSAEVAMLMRELSIKEDLLDNYIGGDGAEMQKIYEEIKALKEKINNPELLENWAKVRERNITINRRMLSWTDLGYISKLVFFADTSHKFGATREDVEILERKVEQLPSTLNGKVHFISGEYQAGALLIGGLQQKYSNLPVKMNLYLDSVNGTEERAWYAENDVFTFDKNFENHARAIGIEIVNEFNADFIFYAHTPLTNTDNMIKHIKANVGRAVVTVPSGSQEFIARLRKEVRINELVAFVGTGNFGTQMGIAIGYAVARYTALQTSKWNHETVATPLHVENLLKGFYDVIYEGVKDKIVKKAKDLGYNPVSLNSGDKEISDFADKLVRPRAIALYASKFHNYSVRPYEGTLYTIMDQDLGATDLHRNVNNQEIKPNIIAKFGTYFPSPFNDVPTGHWAYPHVMKLANLDVFSGDGNNNFYPDAPMLRAHLAITIQKLFKFKVDEYIPNPGFTDVPSDSPYYEAISIVKHLGLMNGTSATTFDPNGSLDRASVAIVISKLFTLDLMAEGRVVPDYFVDAGNISWAKTHINLLGETGIASIPEDKKFNPTTIASRAVVATFLSKALERMDILNAEGKL
ncbi:S-layer domain-containing protein [Bacillus phage BCP78]|uniref:S-layer domain-containing protein n=2 Tax=Tsarbombavirus BCP78 TaxID=1985182 RepID=A0A2S0CSX0_9CAUD|nr:S-layer domain-containing protein [Bacillus phage BCP78]AEW47020.1 S-layer domain-containing protein [Bacillus phage BCP78]AQN32616.1 S-layer domain-containing protein [Bacillus phage BCP12]